MLPTELSEPPSGDEWIFGYCGYVQEEDRSGLGFLPAAALAPAAASGPAAPIVIAVASVVSAIASIFGGFGAQRGRDEATSGEYLTAADTAKNAILLEYQRGNLTKDQARELFESQVIGTFVQKINSLKTESVRESRTTNQVRDLRNLFEQGLSTLPLFFTQGSDDGGSDEDVDYGGAVGDLFDGFIGDSQPGGSDDIYGTEIYADDGSYYWEDPEGNWYYEEANGEYYGGSPAGDSYGGNYGTGEGWEVGVDGSYYWEDPDGYWYYEDPEGGWSSGDPTGYVCTGDIGGNWACNSGSQGGPDVIPSRDRQNQSRAQQKRGTAPAAKATGVQKVLQQVQAGLRQFQQPRTGGQAAQQVRRQQAATGRIPTAGTSNPNINPNFGGASGSIDKNLLIYGGLGLALILVINSQK